MFNQSELLTEFFLYPLILCSVIALAIIIERFYSLRKSKIFPEDFLANVEKSLKNGDIEKAKGMCMTAKTPIAKIYLSIIDNYKNPIDTIKLEVEESGRRAYLDLEKNLEGLSAITTISPLLGLLGTDELGIYGEGAKVGIASLSMWNLPSSSRRTSRQSAGLLRSLPVSSSRLDLVQLSLSLIWVFRYSTRLSRTCLSRSAASLLKQTTKRCDRAPSPTLTSLTSKLRATLW